jgi:hypothetical protein
VPTATDAASVIALARSSRRHRAAIARNIRFNHVALGPAGWGSGGPQVCLHLDGIAAPARQEERPANGERNSLRRRRERRHHDDHAKGYRVRRSSDTPRREPCLYRGNVEGRTDGTPRRCSDGAGRPARDVRSPRGPLRVADVHRARGSHGHRAPHGSPRVERPSRSDVREAEGRLAPTASRSSYGDTCPVERAAGPLRRNGASRAEFLPQQPRRSRWRPRRGRGHVRRR